jgi:hypothetical protein
VENKIHIVSIFDHSDWKLKISVQDSRIFASCVVGCPKLALREISGR